MIHRLASISAVAAIALAVLAGCSQQPGQPRNNAPVASIPSKNGTDDHEHLQGAHGGKIFTIGSHQYHGEAVLEKGGIVRFFTYDKDEARILEVAAEPVTAYVKGDGDMDAISIVFRPEPQKGDADAMTSQFVAHLPKELTGKKLEVSIPNFRVGKERFRIAFQVGETSGHVAMPAKVADEEEKKLYLTPGGLYTSADIKANGNMTASQKFQGIKPAHDAQPKPGDSVCPISETKANDKFVWVIGGKKYEFCCPPCVDEFLIRAKEKPDTIKPPEEYRKK